MLLSTVNYCSHQKHLLPLSFSVCPSSLEADQDSCGGPQHPAAPSGSASQPIGRPAQLRHSFVFQQLLSTLVSSNLWLVELADASPGLVTSMVRPVIQTSATIMDRLFGPNRLGCVVTQLFPQGGGPEPVTTNVR